MWPVRGNYCNNENATMSFVCIVELHVTPASSKILSVAQKCFYVQSMSPATIKRNYLGLHVRGRYSSAISTKLGV